MAGVWMTMEERSLHPAQAVGQRRGGAPAGQSIKPVDVRHVVTLISGAPGAAVQLDPTAGGGRDLLDEIAHADGVAGTAADVEGATCDLGGRRGQLRLGETHGVDEVVDVEGIPDLQAVAIDRDWPSRQRADEEMRDPSLVRRSALVGTVDAAHAKN